MSQTWPISHVTSADQLRRRINALYEGGLVLTDASQFAASGHTHTGFLKNDVNAAIEDANGNSRFGFVDSGGIQTYIAGNLIKLFRDDAFSDQIAEFGSGVTFLKTTVVNAEFFNINYNSAGSSLAPNSYSYISYGSANTLEIRRHLGAGSNDVVATFNADNSVDFDGSLTANGNPVVEETSGTWTPVIAGSTTAGSHTYVTQTGTWVKHGNLVFITGDVQITAYDGTMAGNLQITGLPEAAEPDTSGVSFGLVSFGNSPSVPADFLQFFGNVVNNVIVFRYAKSGGEEGPYPAANTANFMRFRFSATYKVG